MEENQSFSSQKKIDKGFAVLAKIHSLDPLGAVRQADSDII